MKKLMACTPLYRSPISDSVKIGVLNASNNHNSTRRIALWLTVASERLGDKNLSLEVINYDMQNGKFPASADECRGFVGTGSASNVDDGLPWMGTFGKLIKGIDISETGKLFGICFTHQFVLQVLGGTVSKSERGWALSLRNTKVKTPFYCVRSSNMAAPVFHRYQVTELPKRKDVVHHGESKSNAFDIISVGTHFLTTQLHPEKTTLAAREDLQRFRPALIQNLGETDEHIDTACGELTRSSLTENYKCFGAAVLRFFLSNNSLL